MTKLLKSMAASLALIAGQASAAIVYDFQDLTDNKNDSLSGELAVGYTFTEAEYAASYAGERAFNYFDWEKDGLTLTATAAYKNPATYSGSYSTVIDGNTYTAYNDGDDMVGWAYLDQGGAGLGVCHAGLKTDNKGSNQCDPGSDDNVTINEWLMISFDELVTIDFSLTDFRNAGHNIFDPSIQISLDGGTDWGAMDLNGTFTSENFYFRTLDNDNQFYMDALSVTRAVPEPQTLLLLMLGLGGLFVARRNQV